MIYYEKTLSSSGPKLTAVQKSNLGILKTQLVRELIYTNDFYI